MWWPIIVLILLIYYFGFVFTPYQSIREPQIPKPVALPFHYEFTSDSSRHQLQFSLSNGKVWQFKLDPAFYFDREQIYEKDDCFGKNDGALIKAQGFALYSYIRGKQIHPNKGGQFKTHVVEAIQHGHLFYFQCRNNRIHELSTCAPGQVFDKTNCVAIDPCTNQPDGTVFADAFDRQFYFSCPEGRTKCPKGTFFILDTCRSETSLENACLNDPNYKFPINQTTFIACNNYIPQVLTCPPNHIFRDNQCIPDICNNQPDGTKIPFPKENIGPFWYSSGYYVCKDNKMDESIECSSEWDKYQSKGDNVIFIPQVFHRGKCTIPEFCENVTTLDSDIVVPAYDFTKNVKNWQNSFLFDHAIGYKCENGHKIRIEAPAGKHIYDFKFQDACDAPGKRVVLGNRVDSFYDCDQKTIVSCPPSTFFDGTTCKNMIDHAHKYKNIDMFRLNHLKFNWIEPWNYSGQVEPTCQDPESVYLYGYNVCVHPECQTYPFLKQLKAYIQLDEWSKCVFRNGKISKVKTARKKHFNFWTQRKSIEKEPCVPGSKIKSGHFLIDSVIYSTCDSKQPFVFCPSSLTSHIDQINGVYACIPRDDVFEFHLNANTPETFLDNHLARIIVDPSARLVINGVIQPIDANGIVEMKNESVSIMCDQDVRLIFKILVNYPPQTYFENKQLKLIQKQNQIFLTRYKGGSTKRPIQFNAYDVQESVTGFRSDAS